MSIITNLITIFPKGPGGQDIIPDIFEKIWHKLDVIKLSEIQSLIKELEEKERTDLVALIFLCQEHIIIDNNNELDVKMKYIENFKHLKYIDFANIMIYNNLFDNPKVRNIVFSDSHKYIDDAFTDPYEDSDNIVIDIFLKHIQRWKGCIRIEYQGNFSLIYDNGYISFDRPYLSIKQLIRLKPEGYIPMNGIVQMEFLSTKKVVFSHLNLYHALCIPTIDRIKFNSIPKSTLKCVNLRNDILITSCLIAEIDFCNEMYLNINTLFEALQNIYQGKNSLTFDTSKSRIKHILFDDKNLLQTGIRYGTHEFLDIKEFDSKIEFPNLISMRIPIEFPKQWTLLAPNVKRYVSYTTTMIKYYEELDIIFNHCSSIYSNIYY
jgi:hypothetical protein